MSISMKTTPIVVAATCLAAGLASSPALAVEGGSGFYLLGSRTSMGGYVPPPGTYLNSTTYAFVGNADLDFATGGVKLSGQIDADAFLELPTAIHVIDSPVLGGNFGLLLTVPIGWKSVSSEFRLTGPASNVLESGKSEDSLAFGDPVVGATLGWQQGKWFTSVTTIVNVPIGDWTKGSSANIGFNRWGLDLTGAATWLDPDTGWEVSGAMGMTFNGNNDDTDYHSGDEFHFEFAGMKAVSKTASVGLNGYYYQQVTDDTGGGAVLGGNRGEVWGIGPAFNASFEASGRPVSMSLRMFHEFNAKRRIPGDSILLSLTIPL
jgi:hypothetical protein